MSWPLPIHKGKCPFFPGQTKSQYCYQQNHLEIYQDWNKATGHKRKQFDELQLVEPRVLSVDDKQELDKIEKEILSVKEVLERNNYLWKDFAKQAKSKPVDDNKFKESSDSESDVDANADDAPQPVSSSASKPAMQPLKPRPPVRHQNPDKSYDGKGYSGYSRRPRPLTFLSYLPAPKKNERSDEVKSTVLVPTTNTSTSTETQLITSKSEFETSIANEQLICTCLHPHTKQPYLQVVFPIGVVRSLQAQTWDALKPEVVAKNCQTTMNHEKRTLDYRGAYAKHLLHASIVFSTEAFLHHGHWKKILETVVHYVVTDPTAKVVNILRGQTVIMAPHTGSLASIYSIAKPVLDSQPLPPPPKLNL